MISFLLLSMLTLVLVIALVLQVRLLGKNLSGDSGRPSLRDHLWLTILTAACLVLAGLTALSTNVPA